MSEKSDLEIELGITLSKLTKQLTTAEARMTRMGKKFEDDFRKITDGGIAGQERFNRKVAELETPFMKAQKAARGLLPAIGVAAVVAGLAKIGTAAQQAIADVARIGDQASLAGLDTTAFQELDFLARQARIPMDTLADGVKELQLRADEFSVTGKGPAAEAFERLGMGAEDVAAALKNPSDMFLQIIGDLEQLDKAAQIRISDELFGGSAGERFVQLIGEGEEGLRDMIARGHDLGVILDQEAIAKAQELDAKFAEVQARISTMWQGGVVGAADFFGLIETEAEQVQEILDRIRGSSPVDLGANIDGLETSELEASAAELEGIYGTLIGEAGLLERELESLGLQLAGLGQHGAAQRFYDLAQEVRNTTTAFEDGEISAEALTEDLEFIMGASAQAASGLEDFGSLSFDGLIARLGAVSTTMQIVAGWATTASTRLQAVADVRAGPSGGGGDDTLGSGVIVDTLPDSAPVTSPRPRPAPLDIDFGVPAVVPSRPASSGRSGGGAARPRRDEAAEIIKQAQAEAEALEFRLTLIGKTEQEIARLTARQEMLNEAKKNGADLNKRMSDTGLTLAESIDIEAGRIAEMTAELEQAQSAQEFFANTVQSGKDAILDMAVTGEFSMQRLGDAIKRAAAEWLIFNEGPLANGGFASIFGGGSSSGGGGLFGGLLGSLFGGFRADGGPVDPSKAYVVGERGPEMFVPNTAGQIIPNGAMSSGSGGAVKVEVFVRDDGRLGAIARQEGARGGQQVAAQVRSEVPAIMDNYNKRYS